MDHLYSVYGPSVQCVWAVCTVCMGRLYSVYGPSVQCVSAVCTVCMGRLYSVYGPSVQCVSAVCTVCMGRLYSVYRPSVQCVWAVCTVCMGRLYSVYGPSVQCVWAVCTVCMGHLTYVAHLLYVCEDVARDCPMHTKSLRAYCVQHGASISPSVAPVHQGPSGWLKDSHSTTQPPYSGFRRACLVQLAVVAVLSV